MLIGDGRCFGEVESENVRCVARYQTFLHNQEQGRLLNLRFPFGDSAGLRPIKVNSL